MELFLERFSHGTDSTLGYLSIEGKPFCFICEDEYREKKVAGETRIPAGRYEIKLNTAGGKNAKYKQLFPEHKGMLELQDVPNFTYVYIHIGNDESDTDGCLLTGYGAYINASSGGGYVQSSKAAYIDLYRKVIEVIETERVFISISDHL